MKLDNVRMLQEQRKKVREEARNLKILRNPTLVVQII